MVCFSYLLPFLNSAISHADIVSDYASMEGEAFLLFLASTLVAWCNGDEERQEQLESHRECCRSIITVTGIHRGTAVLGEAWVVLTAAKISFGGRALGSFPLPPVASAAPSKEKNDLDAVGQLRHASILEEEVAFLLDWCNEMLQTNKEGEIRIWLQDFRFMVKAAHFSLMNRRT